MLFFAWLAPILLIAAFVLLLLVTLSVPIIKSILLFKLVAKVSEGPLTANGNVKFGMWGYCTSGFSASIAGFSRSTAAQCTPRRLGYTVDPALAELLGIERFTGLISRTLTGVLVLHPIACALTLIALILSFLMVRPSRGTTRFSSLMTLLASILAAVVTTAVFIIDVVLVAVVRNRIRDETDGRVGLNWGNGVWMVLGATVALWLSLIFSTCGIFQLRRQRRRDANIDSTTRY